MTFTKQQNKFINILSRYEGKYENSYLFSLSNNFNLIQRDLINIIELSVKYMRSVMEKNTIQQTASELDSKIKELRNLRSTIELAIKEPKRISNDLPPKIKAY